MKLSPLLLSFALAVAVSTPGTAVLLTSKDGRTREFPIVVSASPKGLVVRTAADAADLTVPWERIDLIASQSTNPWLVKAHARAAAGATVDRPAETEAVTVGTDGGGEWRTLKSTVTGGEKENFSSLSLSAYVHREVEKPRLAIVWVGAPSPLASRGDAADFARRLTGALVVADFKGGYGDASGGSGAALVKGLTDLFADGPDQRGRKAVRVPPAIIIIGRGDAAAFAWSLACSHPKNVLAAVTIDGDHRAEPNAGVFATPVLFIQTGGPARLDGGSTEDLSLPFDLWRHYSTDGCRWCFAAQPADPLALSVAFAREVAAASPYKETLGLLEEYENSELKHRIPAPMRSAKDLKETGFLLATLDGRQTYPIASRTGPARNDLVWVPSAGWARLLPR